MSASEAPSCFEKDVMMAILSDLSPTYSPLLAQLATARVCRREKSSRGFYTYFMIPERTERVNSREKMQFGGVIAELNGLKYGLGFLLYVRDGKIEYLEGYSFEEDWVEPLHEYKLRREAP